LPQINLSNWCIFYGFDPLIWCHLHRSNLVCVP
jgi:hypothetical protein